MSREALESSVIAVPPLCRDGSGRIDAAENRRLMRHIESGGVRILLYGGNANLYHLAPSEYGRLLEVLQSEAGPQTWVVPSVGPAYGVMMDQAAALRGSRFPAVMILPHQGVTSDDGVATGIRRFAEHVGKKVVVYLKFEGYLSVAGVRALVDDGLVSWIKYAVVRKDERQDAYLRQLVETVDPNLIVSGIGEQPALVHLRQFNCVGYTSGCVCVAPGLSMAMLRAAKQGDWDEVERIRSLFCPLEDLRNEINPIRVLHDAVRLAGVAETGPALPLLSHLSEVDARRVKRATEALLEVERAEIGAV